MNNKAKYPDFFDQRCIIWTNINLFNGFDYEELRGHCCVCQDTQIVRALKLNNDALDEILEIMDVEVEQPIISIDMHYDADDEAMSDCYIFPYCNLNGCFCFSGDGIKEWYIDEKDDLRAATALKSGISTRKTISGLLKLLTLIAVSVFSVCSNRHCRRVTFSTSRKKSSQEISIGIWLKNTRFLSVIR